MGKGVGCVVWLVHPWLAWECMLNKYVDVDCGWNGCLGMGGAQGVDALIPGVAVVGFDVLGI